MFIKTSKRIKNNKIFYSHYLTEGYRDKDGKPRHRHLSNLSALPDEVLLVLKALLKGSGNKKIETIDINELQLINSVEYGSIALFSKLYEISFGKYLKNLILDNHNEALKKIIINKIFESKSKNGLNNWLKLVDMEEVKNKNDLYESLDSLENVQEDLERKLIKNSSLNNKKGSILLYDITSTYFEGKGAEELCKYGYSRDHRSDRLQVNIGLVTDSEGLPVSVEIIDGNIGDKQTLQGRIASLKEKYGIEEVSFIFDRGMKSKVNLEYLQKEGYNYITALSHSELKKKAEENKDIEMSLFDKQDLAEFEIDDKYYSLVHNPMKADRDKFARNKLLEKTEERLKEIQCFKRDYNKQELQDKVSKSINKYKMEKFIDYEIVEKKKIKKDKKGNEKNILSAALSYVINEEKKKKVEQYDGFYMIESTNKEIKGQDSGFIVERAFDSIKNKIEAI